jgi:hypothetical protein
LPAKPEQVSAVEEWLRRSFPSASVASEGDFDREVYLFRARNERVPTPAAEVEISYEAFDDHPVSEIIAALERHGASDRLRQEPQRRLFLDRALKLSLSAYDPRKASSAPSTIKTYSVLEFASLDESQSFLVAVMSYVGTREGIKWMLDTPQRVVIWQRFRFPPGGSYKKDASTFYVSNGVLQLARTLGVALPNVTSTLTREQLPEERSLLIGLQTDWRG